MKKYNYYIYVLILISFIYLIINLNSSLISLSNVIMTFFINLFPYLFIFNLINQLLIRTRLIYFISYILQFILYPLFNLNAKACSLLLIAVLNGAPSSVLYANIMDEENFISLEESNFISNHYFLPSFSFLFFTILNKIDKEYFFLFIISLYLPIILSLIFNKNKVKQKYITFKLMKNEVKESFQKFNYFISLKSIFINTIKIIINIFGMICFYSIITLFIPSLLIKGLIEFSIPSVNILNSNLVMKTKTILLTIIISFSSFSSISQASLYLDKINIKITEFIKKRILLSISSVSILIVLLYLLPL